MWHLWGRSDMRRRFLVGKPEKRRLIGRSRRRWQENKVDVSDTE
jgi:hypothetical protein